MKAISRGAFVERYSNGNTAALARTLGITRQAIQEWKGSDKPIPDGQVLKVAAIMGITPAIVRPDMALVEQRA